VRHATLLLAALLLDALGGTAPVAAQDRAGTIVLDASSFLDEIPTGHWLTDAERLRVPWIFDNTALRLGTRSNYLQWVDIPRAGTYHLYARTLGSPRSGFRVAVNDEPIPADVGNGPLSFRRVGTFRLPAGRVPVRIMRIEGAPVLDVLVLSTDSTLTEEALKPLQLSPEVKLLREYRIPPSATVKFGDVDGDRKTDFLVLSPDYSAHVFDFSGRELWSWQAPDDSARARRAENEAPGAIWDLDGDGHGEVIHWRMSDGKEWLVAADGRTGRVRYRVPWPTRPLPHVYNNFRIAIGRLSPGRPSDMVLLTDMGGTISVAAFDAQLRPLWNHVEEKKKDHLGHYVYPVDLDGDGIDEVQVGSLLLDSRGRQLWNRFDLFYDNHDHADSYRFPDLDHDGRPEVVSAHSEDGVFAMDARTGKILWQNVAEHSQQIAVGSFLAGAPGPQVVIGARTYGNRQAGEPYLFAQVQWFDPQGRRLARWPANPLNGNPVFAQGDWKGDGQEELFWYKFHLTPQGRGELYFPDDVYQMFDFLGGKAEEVVTLAPGVMRVWGYAGADGQAPRVRHTDEYLRDRVANLTHY
jgi:hypothetical protein